MWQGWEEVETAGLASCNRRHGAAPVSEPVAAGSKADPLLANAEPVSDAGGASVITYLRKG